MGQTKHLLIICVAAALLVTRGSGIGRAQTAGPPSPKAEPDKRYVVFTHSTLSRLGAEHVPAHSAVGGEVSCALARGEYKSLQIGIHAPAADLHSVRLELESDLQARIYRPIDAKTRKLLLGYVNPVPQWIHDACLDESGQIASIGKGKTSFFWLTLHAGENAAAGKHRGKIRIEPEGRPATELDLAVTVRPFKLQRARIAYAPFFYVEYQRIALPRFAQTRQWLGALFRDMAEHSHTSIIGLIGVPGAQIDFPTIPPPQNRTFSMLLPLMKQAGLTSPDIPVLIMDHSMYPESEGTTAQQKNAGMDWYQTQRRKQGWPELATYGWDEPYYPAKNPRLRSYFEPFRDVRMRLGVAMDAGAAYGLGDVHDIWILIGGQITRQMCAEAHRLGAEVWTYISQHLSTYPLHERYYAGLYVWAYGLKGHTTWHHYAQGGYKLIWMREGDQRPMPLVGWETRREGVDDYRYLQMLQDCIAARPGNPLAVEANQWLDDLRARVKINPGEVAPGNPLALEEYDRIRDRAARYIQRLGPVPAAPATVTPTGLKDEAKPFRNKSVQQCIAGLESEQTATRRAAAWALFEKGPQGAPAVRALAGLLGDDETRMPALRALEAIGYQSSAALPELALLTEHPDGFVRMGAAYALGAIGAPAAQALAKAVVTPDAYWPAAGVVRRAFAGLGSGMQPALPILIKLLDDPTWQVQQVALETINAIGPHAASAVPDIMRNWKAAGLTSHTTWWLESLAAIGPGAMEAVPMLENFQKQYRTHRDYSPRALWALCRIRRSPEDLRALVDLIRVEQKPRTALSLVENLGTEARGAQPQIRELIARADLNVVVKKRLGQFLARINGSQQKLSELVDLIGTGQRPTAPAALALLESRGIGARGAAPRVRELIAQGTLSDNVRKRLEAFLARIGE